MTAGDPRIRTATVADAAALAALGARTFEETYAESNDPGELAAHITVTFAEPRIADALRDPRVTYLVADEGGTLVGYAKLVVPSASDQVDAGNPAELEQLYVVSARHGSGVGRALLRSGARHAAGLGCDTLWLGVWERNPKAVRFYRRAGFEQVGRHHFRLGSELQTDLVMALKLPAT